MFVYLNFSNLTRLVCTYTFTVYWCNARIPASNRARPYFILISEWRKRLDQWVFHMIRYDYTWYGKRMFETTGELSSKPVGMLLGTLKLGSVINRSDVCHVYFTCVHTLVLSIYWKNARTYTGIEQTQGTS